MSGDVRAANAFFQTAIKEYPEDPALRARWGELFAATHQDNEAVRLFEEALELDASYAPAKIGLAKIAAGQYEEKTREWAAQVIDETPDQALEAHLLIARAALRREESRGGHFREDFPQRDDIHWQRRIADTTDDNH